MIIKCDRILEGLKYHKVPTTIYKKDARVHRVEVRYGT